MYEIEKGLRIEKLEAIFNKEVEELLGKVGELGYPTGHELRIIAKKQKGEWSLLTNGRYDLINIPFLDYGTLIIERPFAVNEPLDHKVAYRGNLFVGLEDKLEEFVNNILNTEREEAKKDYIASATVDADSPSNTIMETAKLFDK